MSVKKAYIGLSSPLGFDYEFEPELGHPNPILEAPLGVFLLYDEIWFLHHALCPLNMRDLDYVKFLSDYENLEDYREEFEQLSAEDILDREPITTGMPWDDWDNRIRSIAPFATYDNHGQGISGLGTSPDVNPSNFLFDYFVANQRNADFEYITNSAIKGQINLKTQGTPFQDDIDTAERILANRIPNYQSPEGPYFPEIDDYRQFDRRTKFREKILEEDKTADEIQDEFDDIRNTLTSRITRKKNVYDSLMIGTIGRLPGVSEFLGLFIEGKRVASKYSRYNNYGWAGFLAEIEETDADNP